MSLHHGLRSAAGASVADPYFASTSLLLLGNGVNGGQNNTFVDGSSNAFSVTRYGNTTQGTFSPFGYNWGVSFDGSGDYLTVPYSSNLQLGSSDFTIEFFIFFNSVASGQRIVSGDGNSSGTLNWCFYTDSTGTLNYFLSTSGTAWTVSGNLVGNISVGQWYHVALVRNGSTFTPYLNGVAGTTATTSSALYTTTTGITIGAINSGNYFNGNISNLRILKGTAQYTAAFTPPINNLTAITNTSLLTCQSNRFLDNSSNAFAITPYGNASVTNFAPFPTNSEYSTGTNGGSGYFDGSGDYLTVADSTAFDLTGDFTLELFFYPTAWDNSWSIGLGSENSGQNGFTFYANGTSNMGVYGNGAHIIQVTCDAKLYEWNHLALVRSGSTLTLYLNGVSRGTATNSTSFTGITANGFSLGAVYTSTLRVDNPKGYCSSLRLARSAVYTAAFTPPTSPLTAITNTSLLLNFTNASIIDSTGKNDLETVGDAQISTSVKKFGTGSLKFDGTGDFLSTPNASQFDFGTGDFTVEFWVNFTSFTLTASMVSNYFSSTVGWTIQRRSDSAALVFGYGDTQLFSQSWSPSTGIWYHIAATRSGTSLRVFVDGTQLGTTVTNSTSLNGSTSPLVVGGLYFGGYLQPLNGYIDDLRITKGVARYTANFTPPSRQLPAR